MTDFDADTIVVSPEYIYNLLGAGGRKTGKMDNYSLLGMLMHEDMHDWTEQENKIRQITHDMGPVLGPEIKACNPK